MRRSKKFILVALLIAFMLLWSVLGVSCASSEDDGEQFPTASQGAGAPEDTPPGRGFSDELFAEVAGILGIDQQTLEEAFAQAQSEMAASMPGDEQQAATPGGELPTGTPPESMSPGPGLPGDLLARVAEILGIDQQELEDAFAQVQSEMPDGPPAVPPDNASPEE